MPSGISKDPEATRVKMREAALKRIAKRKADIAEAKKLSVEGYNNAAIAERMSIAESSVRSLLNPAPASKRSHSRKPVQKASVPAGFPEVEFFSKTVVDDLKTKLEVANAFNDELSRKVEVAEHRLMGLIDMMLNGAF